jgi:hypothetical protein
MTYYTCVRLDDLFIFKLAPIISSTCVEEGTFGGRTG